jgi:hypothetical protein
MTSLTSVMALTNTGFAVGDSVLLSSSDAGPGSACRCGDGGTGGKAAENRGCGGVENVRIAVTAGNGFGSSCKAGTGILGGGPEGGSFFGNVGGSFA